MMAASSRYLQALLWAIAGAMLFSSKAVLIKLGYRESVGVVPLMAIRMGLAAPFYLWILWKGKEPQEPLLFRDKGMVVVLGLAGYYVSSFLDFKGLIYISAGLERLVLFVYPTFVLLLGALLLRKKITPVLWLAVALAYAGIAVAFKGEMEQVPLGQGITGTLFIAGSALTYAGFLVGAERYIARMGANRFTAVSLLIATAAIFLHLMVTGQVESIATLSPRVWVMGGLLAIFCTVIPSLLIAAAIREAGSGPVAVVSSIGPVSTAVLGYYLLDDPYRIEECIGTLLVIVAIWVISRNKKKTAS